MVMLLGVIWLAGLNTTVGAVATTVAPAIDRPAWSSEDTDYQIDSWQTEQGLPENSATAMVQTPDGYLWFGTFSGLVRFDGVRFSVLTPVNTPQLPSAFIVNLHLDRRHRLWISTDRGLVCRTDREWRTYGPAEGWVGDFVRTFAERGNGDLLLTTFNGQVMELANDRLRPLPSPPGEPGRGYYAHADEEGRWWVIQNRFVGLWDGERWVETIRLHEQVADEVGAGTGQDGSLLLVVRNELQRWRRGVKTGVIRLPEEPKAIWSVAEDRAGNVWVSSYIKGICRIRPDGGFHRWTTTNGLTYDCTRFTFEDQEQNLWVGTSGGGILRFKNRRFLVVGKDHGLSEQNVRSVWPDGQDNVYVATYGYGLFHHEDRQFRRIEELGVASKTVYGQCVLRDRVGRTWMGTGYRGAWLREPQGMRQIPASQLESPSIMSMFEDSHGRVWLGGDRDLAFVESGVIHPFSDLSGKRLPGVVSMAEQPGQILWFSTTERVFRLEDRQVIEVFNEAHEPLRDILSLAPNADGSVWMGTRNAGLLHWHPNRTTRLDAATGFPARGVHAILEDRHGFFWMPSRQGIVRVSRSHLQDVVEGRASRIHCQLLDTHDGLVSVDCPSGLQPICTADPSGRLWFATLKGVATIHPDDFHPNQRPPPIQIESIAFRTEPARASTRARSNPPAGKSLDLGGEPPPSGRRLVEQLLPPFDSAVRIPPGGDGIEIRYSALSFSAPEKVRFQTRMENHDSEWQDAGIRRQSTFEGLPPGQYLFRVRAANNDGAWNDAGAALAIHIQPHLWQTAWFRTIACISVVAALVSFYRRRVQALQKARRNQESISRALIESQETERKRIAADLHDGLGQNLMLINNRLRMIATQPAPPGNLAHEIGEISQHTLRAIAEVRAISSALRPPALEQTGLTRAIEWMVEKVAESSPTRFETELDCIDGQLGTEREIHLYRIIQEALNNVAKHAAASHAILEVKREGRSIRVSLYDNGTGFSPEAQLAHSSQGSHLGLSTMAERAKVLNGRLDLQSSTGRGTRITLTLSLPPSPDST